MNKTQLKYIHRDEIDDDKWEDCISTAANSRFYAHIFHLDRSAENWDALIFEDYKFIMPLPLKKRWGFSFVYQPLFTQQLGIFPNPPKEIAQLFYDELNRRFRYVDTQFNSENIIGNETPDATERQNFLLSLYYNYPSIKRNYSKNTIRNLVKAHHNNLHLVPGIRLEEYMDFKAKNVQGVITKKDLQHLKSIVAFGQYKGFGEIYGVYSEENKLCAAAYFCRWKNRVILMNAASGSLGKELGGMYFLIDSFIQNNAEKNFLLDFEGSTIPGLARFYSGFGASAENYFQLKFNRLPLPIKWVKK